MEHRAEAVADFRTHYNVRLGDVDTVEFHGLMTVLLRNTASWLTTHMSGWEFPASREWFLAADLFDLEHRKSGTKSFKPYPRPNTGRRSKRVPSETRTADELRALLRPGR